ncbi:MAG: TolC family protein [Saprospiraceae bacterium]|nr:TolC family protein [Saprospiraceae bacterium]
MPAEIFGGPAGTFREVTFGQQYNALLSLQPQFDIFNLSAISEIKSAKINQQLTESQNLLNELNLHESVNATYWNIISLKNQKEVLTKNIAIATQIKTIVNDRYKEGIIRKQDVNEAEVNLITLQDKLQQLEYNISLQENVLSLFLENKWKPEVIEDLNNYVFGNALSQLQAKFIITMPPYNPKCCIRILRSFDINIILHYRLLRRSTGKI